MADPVENSPVRIAPVPDPEPEVATPETPETPETPAAPQAAQQEPAGGGGMSLLLTGLLLLSLCGNAYLYFQTQALGNSMAAIAGARDAMAEQRDYLRSELVGAQTALGESEATIEQVNTGLLSVADQIAALTSLTSPGGSAAAPVARTQKPAATPPSVVAAEPAVPAAPAAPAPGAREATVVDDSPQAAAPQLETREADAVVADVTERVLRTPTFESLETDLASAAPFAVPQNEGSSRAAVSLAPTEAVAAESVGSDGAEASLAPSVEALGASDPELLSLPASGIGELAAPRDLGQLGDDLGRTADALVSDATGALTDLQAAASPGAEAMRSALADARAAFAAARSSDGAASLPSASSPGVAAAPATAAGSQTDDGLLKKAVEQFRGYLSDRP